MGEISQFRVTRAEADFDSTTGSLNVTFWYPRSPEIVTERIGPNHKFGLTALDNLIQTGHADIADTENPMSPPNAGSLPMFRDGNFVCTRRDNGAPVHKMFHAGYSGFAQDASELYSEEGMRKLGARESAEEVVFITRDRNPYLIVTDSLEDEIVKSATRSGLGDLPRRKVTEEFLPGNDRLTVKYEDGETAYSMDTFFTMLWNIDSSSIAMQIRKLGIRSDEVLPVDGEGIFTEDGNGYKVHFNRESFIVDPGFIMGPKNAETLDEVGYGEPLRNPQVFQSYMDRDKRVVYTPRNSDLEFLGPGATPVNKGYLWAPQDTLRSCLDGMNILGYSRRKLYLEKDITERFMLADGEGHEKEKCVIPRRYLVN